MVVSGDVLGEELAELSLQRGLVGLMDRDYWVQLDDSVRAQVSRLEIKPVVPAGS